MATKQTKADWFLYSDRANYAPDREGMIVTHGFSVRVHGDDKSVDWMREEWSLRAALIPLDQVRSDESSVSDVAARSVRAHGDAEFAPWWRGTTEFDFGEVRYIGGVMAWPWLHYWTHPLDDERVEVVPRSDFLRYHALDRRPVTGSARASEYVQPLEQSVVMRTDARRVAYYKPTPFAEVQRDYLRDYLAARRAALLIAVVADRFAHASNAEALGLESLELHPIGKDGWVTTTIHEKSPHNRRLAMGRSSFELECGGERLRDAENGEKSVEPAGRCR